MADKAFVVKWDFRKAQPAWQGDYVRNFGERNEGRRVEAPDRESAVRAVASELRYNPFYLTAEEVPADEGRVIARARKWDGSRYRDAFVIREGIPYPLGGTFLGWVSDGFGQALAGLREINARRAGLGLGPVGG